MDPGPAPRDHLPQLDGLRAAAVLAVIGHHTLPGPLVSALNPGAAGVRIFFVLSGFLITGILLGAREGIARGDSAGQALRSFYARRLLRIFPLYYFALAVVLLLGVAEARAGAGWHLAYLSNIYGVRNGWLGHLAHFWSLAVEEQFYLVWPALVLFLPRCWLRGLFLLAVAAGPISRLIAYRAVGDVSLASILTPSCLDSLGLGAFLAYTRREHGVGAAGNLGAFGRSLGLPLLLAVDGYRMLFGEGFVTVAFRDTALALVGLWLVQSSAAGWGGTAGRVLSCRPMVYLGTISYGVYVWHGLAPIALPDVSWLAAGPIKFLVVAVCSVVLASATWFLFEKRLNELKRYFPYSRPARPSRAAVPEPAVV
jgi:peptidoglycan/LPS O-acetylase OafA/YrhL